MEFLLVCTNISTTDFNLSCELPLNSFWDFQNGPAFPRPCVTNSTGSLIQKGSSSNYVAPSMSVCTTVHSSTGLNYAYWSPRSWDVVIWNQLHTATSSYRRRLLSRHWPSWIFLCWPYWPGTVYSLFLRTHLYPFEFYIKKHLGLYLLPTSWRLGQTYYYYNGFKVRKLFQV